MKSETEITDGSKKKKNSKPNNVELSQNEQIFG